MTTKSAVRAARARSAAGSPSASRQTAAGPAPQADPKAARTRSLVVSSARRTASTISPPRQASAKPCTGTVNLPARSVAWRQGAGYRPGMTPPTKPSYAGHRFPPEVISHAIWLYFRFPLSLRMVEEMLAARGILVSHETVRQWALQVRPGVRQPDPPPAAPCRRQVAPR